MSVDKIRDLVELMNDNELVELSLEEENFKLKLKKPGANIVAAPAQMMAAPAPAAAPVAAPVAGGEPAIDMTGLKEIKSPIVGTFYAAPSPDSDNFVSVGSSVSSDTIVCIIEAMKIMNEIKAEISGTIEKVLVENGQPIEYGQPLFLVR